MSVESARISETVRNVMKARGMTSTDMADALGISTATAKRFFSGKDLSLDRISEVAGWLGFTFQQLMDMAFKDDAAFVSLTHEQQEFLADNPNVAAYLGQLREGLSPQEIEKEFGISRSSTHKYLSALDKQSIIEYGPGLRARLLINKFIDIMDAPKLRTTFYSFMLNSGAEHFSEKIEEPGDAYLRMDFFKLTENTYKELQADLEKIYEKYLVSSKYETRSNKQTDLKKITYISLADKWQHSAFREVICDF